MTTERLAEFLVLSQTLSYSKAAKKLFITQSALSRHIMDMEAELGVKLLERSTHGVKLTGEGRLLAARSRYLVQRSASLFSRLRSAELAHEGRLSIACMESVSHGPLMIFLSAFAAKFQAIELRVDVINEADHFSVFDMYDFTFTAFELQSLPSHISSRHVFTSSGVLYANAEYISGKAHHVGLEELAGKTLFVPYADETFCSYSTNRQLTEKLTGGMVKVVKVPTVESAMMMSALGRGVTIVPQNMPRSTVTNMFSIDISTPDCRFETFMYHNKNRHNPASALLLSELEDFTRSGEGEGAVF